MSKGIALRRLGAAFLSMLTLVGLTPAIALAQSTRGRGSVVQVTGDGTTTDGLPVTFNGTLNVEQFQVLTDPAAGTQQIVAVGRLNGKATDASGKVVQNLANVPVAAPVTLPGGTTAGATSQRAVTAQQTCEVLNLVLGPLDLNLLGLVVQLNQVNLQITAESGPGNLLGNLLCAVTGLLDNPATTLSQIVAGLNQILAALLGP